jgi:purine-nucleoside phosphorylase
LSENGGLSENRGLAAELAWAEVQQAAFELKRRGIEGSSVGVVLGSGLGQFSHELSAAVTMDYEAIPHMPRVSVAGHGGKLSWGQVGKAHVLCLQGRAHLYEGNSPSSVVFGVRLLAQLGARAVLLTNAAGGIRAGFSVGDLMLIRDHINLLGSNPLTGANDEEIGPRFVDLTQAYDVRLCEAALRGALDVGVSIHEGVYAAMPGPSYETPAEIRMLKMLGADAVGMSTVPEVIALNHLGVPVGALSCITNLAAGLGKGRLSHEEVAQAAAQSSDRFRHVLARWVERSYEIYCGR